MYKDREKYLEAHYRYNVKHREERRLLAIKWRKENKRKKIESDKEYKKRYPNRIKAITKLNYEVEMGRIQRGKCRDCNRKDTQGHHTNYSKPLKVIWLCPSHHKTEDSRVKKISG